MPRSIFLGRVVGEDEPLWLDDDRAWAIALLQVEAEDCPGCGQPRSETMATRIDERGRMVPAHIYEAQAVICTACQTRDQLAADQRDDTAGRFYTVKKIR